MASPDSSDRSPSTARNAGKSLYNGLLDVVMTGVAIIIPFVVTLYILRIALDFITDALAPFIELLQWLGLVQRLQRVELITLFVELGVYSLVVDFLTELIALAVLFGIVLLVGSVGRNRYGERLIRYLDLAVASIPGIGTVYKSFRRMGDVMLNDEAENFRDIKLVEFLGEELYVLGFETSASPESVETATGHEEMLTMFIPMAPNPVTGGFLTHVPRSKVIDVDMTIEEGVRSILTSGVANGHGGEIRELSMDDLERLADVDRLQDAITVERSDDDPSSRTK